MPPVVRDAGHERLWERIVETLLTDERLRGDLTDEAYKPLLDWAVAAAGRCARDALATPDAGAHVAACQARLRQLLVASSRLAAGGHSDELARLIGPPLFTAATAEAVCKRLRALSPGADATANALSIATALSTAEAPATKPRPKAKKGRSRTKNAATERSKADGSRTQDSR
jgi:hypothetical protein